MFIFGPGMPPQAVVVPLTLSCIRAAVRAGTAQTNARFLNWITPFMKLTVRSPSHTHTHPRHRRIAYTPNDRPSILKSKIKFLSDHI